MSVETRHRLSGKRIILGITGGIAAYKASELIRLYKKAGADVQVVMTPTAEKFVTPLTLGTLSERPVHAEIFPENELGSWTKHIEFGLWGDVYVIAPATAQTMAKLASGMCDSMLTAVALAARCPILVCPSMDHDMWEHPATQESVQTLEGFGYQIMEPEEGELASGLIGKGRLPEPQNIFERTEEILADAANKKKGRLAGTKVLVTAGPTREAIDPVRFISNYSTGTMGYEIAAAAERRGADVILVSGPTSLDTPDGVHRVDVTTAAEMYDAVHKETNAEIIIMVAAVADYAPANPATSKIKKDGKEPDLNLKPTQDILASLGAEKKDGQMLVGFALETDNAEENARIKLEKKNLDWIILNNLNEEGAGFGTETNRVTMIGRDGTEEQLPLMEKREVAEYILDRVLGEGS